MERYVIAAGSVLLVVTVGWLAGSRAALILGLVAQLVGLGLIVWDFRGAYHEALKLFPAPTKPTPQVANPTPASMGLSAAKTTVTTGEPQMGDRIAVLEKALRALEVRVKATEKRIPKERRRAVAEAKANLDGFLGKALPLLFVLGKPKLSMIGTALVAAGVVLSTIGSLHAL